jgi:hypothetical protein
VKPGKPGTLYGGNRPYLLRVTKAGLRAIEVEEVAEAPATGRAAYPRKLKSANDISRAATASRATPISGREVRRWKEHRSEWLFLRLVTPELLTGDCVRRSSSRNEPKSLMNIKLRHAVVAHLQQERLAGFLIRDAGTLHDVEDLHGLFTKCG